MQKPRRRSFGSLFAWYFVSIWSSGYIASKVGLQYAAPFTFLTLRCVFGGAVTCLGVALVAWRNDRSESRAVD